MHDIAKHFPSLKFLPNNNFIWSPNEQTVFYNEQKIDQATGQLALLHEIGHAELGHSDYRSDIALLNMEIDAWEFACEAAVRFEIEVDEVHIDNCLESYRVWLYKRSRCPECEYHGIQIDRTHYRCFMCRHVWRVSRNLSLQPHRMQCTKV